MQTGLVPRARARAGKHNVKTKVSENHNDTMSPKSSAALNTLLVIAMSAIVSSVRAQLPASETARQMAAAHGSFVKHDTNRAATHIHSAAAAVKKDSEKVAESSKAASC